MKIAWQAAGLAMLAALGGCASVTGGTSQSVTVTAVCEGTIIKETSCSLVNDKGRWDIVTPGPLVLQKSITDLAVSCKKAQARGTATFVSKPNGGVWGNAIAGGLIGFAIDSATGAGYNYPEELAVILMPPCPAL
jgi:hypothetical protein